MRAYTCSASKFIAVLAAVTCMGPLWRAEILGTDPLDQPQFFSSSDEAIKALVTATESGEKGAVHKIFGSDIDKLCTGDEVQDVANFKAFAKATSEKCAPVREGENKLTLEIGNDPWPFPIPLVKEGDKWFFDTNAGKEEIINRHIGSDELHGIGVCHAYVDAQKKYASQDRDGSGIKKYALRFKSEPGKKDGLYWETTGSESPAPFADLVEKAHEEGYGKRDKSTGPHPFHGYVFKILTGQGRAAPGGKKNYLVNGNLTEGFALIAYPVRWGQSGVMTFIINQDGKLYQCNLGEKTTEIASKMTEYNPTRKWVPVEEAGVTDI